jgi:hypothetical protein
MHNHRVMFAFLLSPFVPVLLYFLYALALASQPHGVAAPPIHPGAFLGGALLLAYAFALVVWLPLHTFLKRKGLADLRHYAIAGGVSYFLLHFALDRFNPALIGFELRCGVAGALYAFVFWWLAKPPTTSRAV